jgi:hypothetical protein
LRSTHQARTPTGDTEPVRSVRGWYGLAPATCGSARQPGRSGVMLSEPTRQFR